MYIYHVNKLKITNNLYSFFLNASGCDTPNCLFDVNIW